MRAAWASAWRASSPPHSIRRRRAPPRRLPAFDSLEMVPEEEFRSSCQQAGREPPSESHALMLSRLAHEREVRQGLQERCARLKEAMEKHRADIRSRQRAMESIPGLVDEVDKVRSPRPQRGPGGIGATADAPFERRAPDACRQAFPSRSRWA